MAACHYYHRLLSLYYTTGNRTPVDGSNGRIKSGGHRYYVKTGSEEGALVLT
jgi:hypothetical protein